MRSIKDPRHIARILAVMDLYNHFFGKQIEGSDSLNTEELEIGNYAKKIRESIFNGVKERYVDIDELINKYSDPVKTEDLDLVQLQIVRAAVFEGFVQKSIPPKVAVDEAIELVRDFGMEMSTKKIAGILGKIFEKLVKEDPENK
ncbi:MAG: transcription antitermination factor NusB [Bacteroidales bacterium]